MVSDKRKSIIILIIIIIITQGYLAEHECSTNWGDYKLTEIRTNKMLVFESLEGEQIYVICDK